MHDMQVGSEPGALGEGERPGLAAALPPTSGRLVRQRGVKPLGRVEARREQFVGPGEGQHPAQHPQGVGDVSLGQAGARAWLGADGRQRLGRDPDVAPGVAVGTRDLAGPPAAPGRGQAHAAGLGRLGQADLSPILGCRP